MRSLPFDDVRAVGDQSDVTEPLARLMPSASYKDGLSTMRASPAPSDVAFTVSMQEGETPNGLGLSAHWIFWGQFLDHDIDLTPETEDPTEIVAIPGDPLLTAFHRSEYVHGTGETGPREHENVITAEIDASNVYGATLDRQAALRSFEGGALKTGAEIDGASLLPYNTAGQPNAQGPNPAPASVFFLAGDVRANENIALASLHTVWVNEHNHWAEWLAERHPGASDEELFQNARAVVEHLIQKITYEEFLPSLVGDALGAYRGFVPGTDTAITTEFSTAAFRFGHTAIPTSLVQLDGDGAVVDDLELRDAFFTTAPVEVNGVDDTLRGLGATFANEIDEQVVDDLNFLLFNQGQPFGLSLPALNIARGRDHGLAPYVETRSAVVGDIDPATLAPDDFSVISADPAVQAKFAAVYGSVLDVDLWIGAIAEDHLPGLAVGPTVHAIVAEQFGRLRDGDPLFYENRAVLDDDLAEILAATRFSDVLKRSGGVEHVQRDAFLRSERLDGGAGDDRLAGDAGRDLIVGHEGHDRLKGRGGDDDLFGDEGRDRLQGGDGDDGLSGGEGRDHLSGGRGDDALSGGDGLDILKGGRGADAFVFVAGESLFDCVADFERGEDTLVLEGFGADFEDVDIRAFFRSNVVSVDGDVVAVVSGLDRFERLDEDDFAFVG